MEKEYNERGPLRAQKRTTPFKLGKLQIAGILLIVVFVWCIISAVALAMFEIHLLALTEFEDDGKSDVYGFVTDSEGQNIVNATVVIKGTHHFTKTNADGFYSIENVGEGNHEIEASKEGYARITIKVTLQAHIPEHVDFVLEKGGSDETLNQRYGSNLSELRYLNYSTAIFMVIYGSLALLGGILAFFQRYYWVAMTGGICGIVAGVFSIGIIIAPILSIIALIFIVGNQEEFVTSERSFMDRILGVGEPKTRRVGVSRAGPQKYKAAGARPKARVAKPDYEGGLAPIPGPVPEERMGEREPSPEIGPVPESKPSMVCLVCKGTVKSETQGIFCECGTCYHMFCAKSISVCKNCGAPL